MLEGSEQAFISINKDSMELQSVDSLSICACLFKFPRTKFFKYEIAMDFQVTFQLRPLFKYIKSVSAAALSFKIIDGSLWAHAVSTFEKSNQKKDMCKFVECRHSSTVYFNISRDTFRTDPCFYLHPIEFVNTVMDLSVGGGYIQIEMSDRDTLWQSTFETGLIQIKMVNRGGLRDTYRNTNSVQNGVSNTYITKFLKQACCIASICSHLHVYVKKNGPIVLQFEMENRCCDAVISIAPVKQ